MSISAIKKEQWENFSPDEQDRIMRMAWEDRSTFEAIFLQFGLNANDVVKFMRRLLSVKSFQRWRTRIAEQGQLKHSKNVNFSKNRFKCSRQRLDGTTKGWK